MKFLIGAIAEGLEFDGTTIYEKSLGGSESAFAFMMRELAALGHQVHAFTKCPRPGNYDGVVYSDVKEFATNAPIMEWDVLLAYRHYGWLTHPSHARLRVLVNHDILVPEGKGLLLSHLWNADALFNLSEYHKKQYCEVAPELQDHIWVTSNGIDLPAIDAAIEGVEKNLKHFVYASRPERGLDVLLTSVWPRLYEKDKGRKLFIAGYTLDAGLQLPEHLYAFYAKMDKLVEETPGVVKAGSLPKPEWYKLLSECALYLYPSAFPEISCCAGDTLVDMPRDYRKCPKGVPIKNLVGKSGFPVYCMDQKTNTFTLGTVKWVKLTKKKAQIVRVNFDDGSYLRVTPEHLIMRTNGKWAEAARLKSGDCVMSLRKFANIEANINFKGRRVPEARLVAEWKYKRELPSRVHAHHDDGDTFNNAPENIIAGDAGKHHRHHGKKRKGDNVSAITRKRMKIAQSNSWRERLAQMSDTEYAAWKAKRSESSRLFWAGMSQEERENFVRERAKKIFTEKRKSEQSAIMLRRMESRWGKAPWRDPDKLYDLYVTKGMSTTEVADRLECRDSTIGHWLKRFGIGARTRRDAQLVKRHGAGYSNHRVVSVTLDGREDVYDMEVDPHHNFVANGVVVHNCIVAAESQACGTPVIATNDFALPETVAVRGCLIPGSHNTKEYQDAFVEKVETLLSDEVLYQNVQQSGRYHVEKFYPWPVVAKEWDRKLHQLFEDRFQKSKYWIFRQLIYNSDILLARELARQEGMPAEQAEAEAIIQRTHNYRDEYAHDDPEVLTRFSSDFTNLGRVPVIAPHVEDAATLLEIGCHYAEHSVGLSNLYPDLKVIATDFSPECIAQARRFQETVAKYPENIVLRVRDWSTALDPVELRVDVVFAGEILEHVEDPYALIDCLETYVKPGGRIIITVPSGPWEAQSLQRRCHFSESDPRYHISDFRFRDIQEVFSKKKDFSFFYCPNGITERGELAGNWVIVYTAAASPTGRIDPRRKFLTTRPYQGISTCVIVGNEESNIRRCLESVKGISDEIIVVGTPACADRTLEIAEEMGAHTLRTTADSPDTPLEIIARCGSGDFGWWRNESIKNAQYPWIFWIDADEVLTGSSGMHKYLHSQLFNGFVVRQHHLCLDTKVVPDVPIRLFKNFEGYRFFGSVHEHCMSTLNGPIAPAYQLEDVNIAHFGYITEADRRKKCYGRNIALLMKDRLLNPDRILGWILLQRDYHNFISQRLEETRGVMDDQVLNWLQSICGIFREHFASDPESVYYKLSYNLYQQALCLLGQFGVAVNGCKIPPVEVGLWLGGSIGGLSDQASQAAIPRIWFADREEYVAHVDKMRDKLADILSV